MKKIILKIEGMTCSACSSSLEKYLLKQEGINDALVNLVMSSASISYEDNITEDDLKLAENNVQKLTDSKVEEIDKILEGKEKEVTFKTNRELREDAYLKLEVMLTRGVTNWEEVQFDEMPKEVQEKYN